MMKVKFGNRNRFENDQAVVGIMRSRGTYIVNIIDKPTNNLIIKEYKKKEAINNITTKYGIYVEF